MVTFFHIADARYVDDYKVEVSFDNGRKGIADLTDALKGPMFEPLKEKAAFSTMNLKCSHNSDNGAISPESACLC